MTIIHPDAPAGASLRPARTGPALLRGVVTEVRGERVAVRLAGGKTLRGLAPEPLRVGQSVLVEPDAPAEGGADQARPAPPARTAPDALLVRLLGLPDLAPGEAAGISEKLEAFALRLAAGPLSHGPHGEAVGRLALLASRVRQRLQGTDPRQLERETKDAGLFLEARLLAGDKPRSDLKADLLRLLELLAGLRDRIGTEDLPEPAKQELLSALQDHEGKAGRLLDAIGLRQGLALARSGGESVPAVSIPLHGAFEGGELEIRRDAGRGGRRDPARPPRVVLRLRMSRLGLLRAEILESGGRISLSIAARQGAPLEALRAELPELRRRLGRAGLEVGHLVLRPAVPEEEPAPPSRYLRTA